MTMLVEDLNNWSTLTKEHPGATLAEQILGAYCGKAARRIKMYETEIAAMQEQIEQLQRQIQRPDSF